MLQKLHMEQGLWCCMTSHEAEVARLHSSGAMGVEPGSKTNFVADSVRIKSQL